MKTANSFGIQFIARTGKADQEQAMIFARITVNGQKTELSLKTTIETKSWNQAKQCVKSGKDARAINNYIEQIRFRLTECYRQVQLDQKELSPQAIKNAFLGIGHEPEKTLGMLMAYHSTHMKTILAWGTMKNYGATEKYIKKFLLHKFGHADIALSKLNFQFITEFELFLRQHKPIDHQKPLGNNGLMKHMERLKKIARLGEKMQWLAAFPFSNYQLKFHPVDRDYLTADELAILEEKNFDLPRMQWVKDLFVFSCYTGLAYIDVMGLSSNSVTLGIDGENWIRTARKKTDTPVYVPLLPRAVEIIQRYRDDVRAQAKGTLFPTISNQKLNSYLKEIADVCGIKKNLTFHIARHTFATTVTLSNGVPIETVSKMLGHTKIATTQVYARVIERKISDDMKMLRSKLSAIGVAKGA